MDGRLGNVTDENRRVGLQTSYQWHLDCRHFIAPNYYHTIHCAPCCEARLPLTKATALQRDNTLGRQQNHPDTQQRSSLCHESQTDNESSSLLRFQVTNMINIILFLSLSLCFARRGSFWGAPISSSPWYWTRHLDCQESDEGLHEQLSWWDQRQTRTAQVDGQSWTHMVGSNQW